MNEEYSTVCKRRPPKPILFYVFYPKDIPKVLSRLESLGYKCPSDYSRDTILNSPNLKGVIINDPYFGIDYISGLYRGDKTYASSFHIGTLTELFKSEMYANIYNPEFQSNISKSKGLLL